MSAHYPWSWQIQTQNCAKTQANFPQSWRPQLPHCRRTQTNFRKKLRTCAQTVGLSNTLSNTQQNIDAVKTQVGGVEKTVGSISGTVGVLQKLSQIDQELLMKYSKVYFMNENYTPSHLTDIPADYLYSALRSEQFLTEAW